MSAFDLLKYRKLAMMPRSSPPAHPLATAPTVDDEESDSYIRWDNKQRKSNTNDGS